MESVRDVKRAMEREIAKGSSPLKLDHIEFGDYSYQEIMSQEKLFEVLTYLLRIGDFKQYAGKTRAIVYSEISIDCRFFNSRKGEINNANRKIDKQLKYY
ncbi:hypothetical protein [Blautia sp. NSJ-157]|uniref:hypothetical protein n=1 Tax=Blautia sp. NSJ-157 TaxID=2931393 RepID=UPI002ED47357